MEQAPTIRILLVEDNLDDAMLLGRDLERAQGVEFDVTLAGSMAEASAHLAGTAFDVVVLDMGLPDGFGVGNVKTVRDIAPDTAVVVLTGSVDEAMSNAALQSGAQDFLLKGSPGGSDVVRVLQRAIQRERANRRAVMKLIKDLGSSRELGGVAPGAEPSAPPSPSPGSPPPSDPSSDTIPVPLELDSRQRRVRPADQSLSVGTRLGNYVITGMLGRGGMAVVYEARHTALDRPAAVKVMPKTATAAGASRERFLQEGKAAARVEHPNVVAVYDVGETESEFYIAMQLVTGRSADKFMEASGPPPWQEATRIVLDACKGLIAIHDAGFVHRDVKPANVLIAADAAVKIVDFGLARALQGPVPSLTGAGNVVGSPPYMSPEQCRAGVVDHRADIYGLGATYYCLLTGRQPYDAAPGPLEVLSAHCHAPVPDPRAVDPSIPGGCARIVETAMAKEPLQRFQSAGEMQAALEAVLAGGGGPQVRSSSETPADDDGSDSRRMWRRFWLWFAAGAAVVGLLYVIRKAAGD